MACAGEQWKNCVEKLNTNFSEVQLAHLQTVKAAAACTGRVACTLSALTSSILDCALQCGTLDRRALLGNAIFVKSGVQTFKSKLNASFF